MKRRPLRHQRRITRCVLAHRPAAGCRRFVDRRRLTAPRAILDPLVSAACCACGTPTQGRLGHPVNFIALAPGSKLGHAPLHHLLPSIQGQVRLRIGRRISEHRALVTRLEPPQFKPVICGVVYQLIDALNRQSECMKGVLAIYDGRCRSRDGIQQPFTGPSSVWVNAADASYADEPFAAL